jgi:hypothetical protein
MMITTRFDYGSPAIDEFKKWFAAFGYHVSKVIFDDNQQTVRITWTK